MLNINKHTKTKPTPASKFNKSLHMCAYIIMHNCHTQVSTEQFWLFFLLTSRQSPQLKCCLLEEKGSPWRLEFDKWVLLVLTRCQRIKLNKIHQLLSTRLYDLAKDNFNAIIESQCIMHFVWPVTVRNLYSWSTLAI